ncbi:MAG: HEPN domain-containing protein [Candidatus Paceibacterota bacterium]|jgi:HEPN domain-containing protein
MTVNERIVFETIKYWIDTSNHDYRTMIVLFNSKEYSNSLFFGHIVLEKILKAIFVKRFKNHPPFTHDLVVIARATGLNLSFEEMLFLKEVNYFNIRARYPEKKMIFYKKCTLSYTKDNLERIIVLHKKICQYLK